MLRETSLTGGEERHTADVPKRLSKRRARHEPGMLFSGMPSRSATSRRAVDQERPSMAGRRLLTTVLTTIEVGPGLFAEVRHRSV